MCDIQLRVKGVLAPDWRDYFGQLVMSTEEISSRDAVTVLSGYVPDQAALIGILNCVHSLNMTLVSVEFHMPQREPVF